MKNEPLIYTGSLQKNCLKGQVAVITGAGGGIGFETARSLAYLGSRVILAEINPAGKIAAEKINQEIGINTAKFIKTDIGCERSVKRMAKKVFKHYGRVDIVINNAAIAPLGSIISLPIKVWDKSYRVNLRGPVLLARQFLPTMIEQDGGVFVCVGSEGLTYMGAYETLKAAQLHLARTIDAELENTNVITYNIGPGMVPTDTALKGIEKLAELFKKPIEEMMSLVEEHTISIEAAGAGLAASVALAPQFRGQEIGAKQALLKANISIPENQRKESRLNLSSEKLREALSLCREVFNTLKEQSEGWQQRSVFERQWVIRDFKKHAGMPVEQWLESLRKLEQALKEGDQTAASQMNVPLVTLLEYYKHLQELSRGYIKDPDKLEESLQHIKKWEGTLLKLIKLMDVDN